MNRVCSAGTGSFLEEQAVTLGVDDIAEFGTLAGRAARAPDLGHTCTVFVTDLVADALAEGYSRDEVFAGLQYSVIRNYANRVMGNRRLLDRVFFQGKPASNPSLARTLAAVTGREVLVPPDPGAMGAIGIAMLADAALGGEDGERAAGWRFDLRRLATARVRRPPRAALRRRRVRQLLPYRDGRGRRRGRAAHDPQRRQLPALRGEGPGRAQAAARGAEPLP